MSVTNMAVLFILLMTNSIYHFSQFFQKCRLAWLMKYGSLEGFSTKELTSYNILYVLIHV